MVVSAILIISDHLFFCSIVKIFNSYIAKRCDTIEKIISRWAPPKENNTNRYINSVCRLTGMQRKQQLLLCNKSDVIALISAMCHMECSYHADLEEISQAYDMWLNEHIDHPINETFKNVTM